MIQNEIKGHFLDPAAAVQSIKRTATMDITVEMGVVRLVDKVIPCSRHSRSGMGYNNNEI